MNPTTAAVTAILGVLAVVLSAAAPNVASPTIQKARWLLLQMCDEQGNRVGERIYNSRWVVFAEPTLNPNVVRVQIGGKTRYICTTWDAIKQTTGTVQ